MAEKQSKLGDSWNRCAERLLKHLGWQHIGDSNIDLPGSDSKEYGIDSILKYAVAGKSMMQTAILESKRYKKASIQSGTLQKWIECVKDKLNALRNSKELLIEFDELDGSSPTNLGILMIWVHDADEKYLNETFQKYLDNTIINTSTRGTYSRIMVLDNRRIVRLCSMVEALQKFDDYNFVYPAGIVDNDAIVENHVLSVEYMMSDLIIAECQKDNVSSSVVFYFGKMSESTINTLMEFLKVYQRIDSKKQLIIYHYDHNDRTMDIISSYKEKEILKDILDFRKLTHYALNDEPSVIANGDE